jgi:hypothetical protein
MVTKIKYILFIIYDSPLLISDTISHIKETDLGTKMQVD